MEAKLKMKVQYDESYSYEPEVPFVNVLPKEPNEAYRRLKHQYVQEIKKTQRIPFPSIRQLILMYTLPNQQIVDTLESELLKQKLENYQYKQQHKEINKSYDELFKEKERLQKLYEVVNKYIQKRQKLVSSDLRRTLHKRYDHSQLSNELSNLQNIKQNKLRQLQHKMNESMKSMVKIDSQKQKIRIQQEYNHNILKLFQTQLPLLQKISSQFHQNIENAKWFKLYIDQFQKSLVFIMSCKKISGKSNKRADQRLLKDSFQSQIGKYIKYLQQYLINHLQQLFQWRSQIKFVPFNNSKQWQQKIKTNIYDLIPDIISILQKDKESIKNVQQQINRQYLAFLPGYYDAKQVALFYKKQSKIQQILENQRQLLINHLKKNYSMMVFYSKSPEYMQCIEEYKSKNKGYLKDILKKKIGLLDIAITFINKQYGQLYKQACDGRGGIRQKILSKCRSLEQNLKQNQVIQTLIMQGCRRLLNIVVK